MQLWFYGFCLYDFNLKMKAWNGLDSEFHLVVDPTA